MTRARNKRQESRWFILSPSGSDLPYIEVHDETSGRAALAMSDGYIVLAQFRRDLRAYWSRGWAKDRDGSVRQITTTPVWVEFSPGSTLAWKLETAVMIDDR